MANQNRIILVGRLTADPETRSTVEGMAIARFTLAVNRPFGGQQADSVDFINVVVWQKLAEICGQFLKKGRLVLVEGRIQNRSFDDASGQRRWVTEVVAREMKMLDQSGVGRTESGVRSQELGVESQELGMPLSTQSSEPLTIEDEELSSELPF